MRAPKTLAPGTGSENWLQELIFAPLGRDFFDRRPHLGVERIELGQIALRVRTKGRRVRGDSGSQRVADIGDIDFGVTDGLPGVRIGFLAEIERSDSVARDDDRGLAAR